MSDNLTLEDGRTWWASTVIVANVLYEISESLKTANPEFSRWLSDKSDRPAPFMYFDLRGLTAECINQFYVAAEESYGRLSGKYKDEFIASSYGIAFSRLIEMHNHILSGGRPSEFSDLDRVNEFDGELIDFNELWSST
jgi:hypothetical protein